MRQGGVRLFAAMVVCALTVGVLVGCAPAATETAAPGILEVSVPGNIQPTVEVAPLSEPAVAEITGLGQAMDFVMGTPMSIELDGEFPAEGAVLTRSYAQPLPDDAAATFAYWDEEVHTWQAVPTTISDDRLTITATVHHFSWWNDFVSGSRQALGAIRDGAIEAGQQVWERAVAGWNAAMDDAEALHWSLGVIFSTRVELPECDNPTPNWVIDLPVSFEVDDPVRFCVGHDKANPDLLVVKARADRGYGFPVTLNPAVAWEYNSTNENTLGRTIDQITALDAAVGTVVAELWARARYIGPGEEISFGIPATALSGYDSKTFIQLGAPNIGQFISSTVTQQLVAWGIRKADASLAAIIAVASCWNSMRQVNEPGKAAGAVAGCLNSIEHDITKTLQSVLLANGSTIATAEGAGKLVGRIGFVLALLPAGVSTANYIAELIIPPEVRALKVTTSTAATPTPESEAWLITAQGIGPIRLASVQQDFERVLERRFLCSGADVTWAIAGTADDDIGGGERGPWIQVSGTSSRSQDAPAPRTESGITLGSSVADLQTAGFYSNVDSEFWYTTIDGVVLTAVVHANEAGNEVVTSLVLGKEGLGVYGC